MCKHKMDATPSFGVTMIPEVPSNPQLTLIGCLNFIGRLYIVKTFRDEIQINFRVCVAGGRRAALV